MLSTPALAEAAAQAGPANPQKLVLPAWNSPSTAGDAFRFPGTPSPRARWNVPGPPRKYFSEWLPALFERTLAIDEWKGEKSQLHWIFTGPMGGFTVEVGAGRVRPAQRDPRGTRKGSGRNRAWNSPATFAASPFCSITGCRFEWH